MTTKETEYLNEPWRDYERRQRREQLKRSLIWLMTGVGYLILGAGIGAFLQYLLN